ncbi:MAG: alpha/beta fold hydrolase [Actinomycetes bacterium]
MAQQAPDGEGPGAEIGLGAAGTRHPAAFGRMPSPGGNADVDPETARVMAATQRPWSGARYARPSGPPAWRSIPSWYLVGTEDRAIPPAGQRFMAERGNARIEEVAASHASMVSQPEAVTRLILRAVEATAAARQATAVPRPPGQRLRAPDSDLVLCRSLGSLFRTPPDASTTIADHFRCDRKVATGSLSGLSRPGLVGSQVGWTAKTCHSSGTPLRAWIPDPGNGYPSPPRDPSRSRRRQPHRRRQAMSDGCSASAWSAPDGSRLLTLDASSVQTAPDGYRRIVWMIKAHPTQNRMARQATRSWPSPPATRAGGVVRCCSGSIRLAGFPTDPIPADCRGPAGGAPLAWSAVRRRSARRLPRRGSDRRWPPAPS